MDICDDDFRMTFSPFSCVLRFGTPVLYTKSGEKSAAYHPLLALSLYGLQGF